MSNKVVKALEEAKASGKVPKDIFDEAHKEIYKIIDKDSFSRFKKNDGEIQELCDALFAQCDKDGSGQVTLDEYKAWVKVRSDELRKRVCGMPTYIADTSIALPTLLRFV